MGIREIQECGNSGIRGIRELGNSGIWELGNSGHLRTAGNESGSASQIPGIDSQRGCGRCSTPVPPGGVGSRSGGAFQVFPPLPLPLQLILSRSDRAGSSRGARGRADSGALVPAGSSGKCSLYVPSSGNGAGRIPGAGGIQPHLSKGHRDPFSSSLEGIPALGRNFPRCPREIGMFWGWIPAGSISSSTNPCWSHL